MYAESTLSIGFEGLALKEDRNITQSSYDEIKYDNIFSLLKQWIYVSAVQSTPITHEDTLRLNGQLSEVKDNIIDFESSNKIRIQLLARKYIANNLSSEEEARFQIESERVRKLMPLVTDSDMKKIGDSLLELKKIKKRHAKIRKYLGMK